MKLRAEKGQIANTNNRLHPTGALEFQKLTQQNKVATLLLIFSAVLVFFDPTASLILGIPRQVLTILAVTYAVLVPLYVIKNRAAYMIGIILAAFVIFFYRTRIPSPSLPVVPILQYFLGFFTLLSFAQTRRPNIADENES